MVSEGEAIDSLLSAMREFDIVPTEQLVFDGRLHRFHVEGDRKTKRNGWYVAYFDEHPAGIFGCKKRLGDDKKKWSCRDIKAKPLTSAERKVMRDKAIAQKKQRDLEITRLQSEAAADAHATYEAAKPCLSHPYLKRKHIDPLPDYVKVRVGTWEMVDRENGEMRLVSDSMLMIPIYGMREGARVILSLQGIMGDGTKLFWKGGAIQGNYFTIGKPRDQIVLICEGFATGVTLARCTGHAVAVAFTAGNLVAVAKEARRRMPACKIFICADNDQWTLTPIPNPGVHFAKLAAQAISGTAVVPQFATDVSETKETDFNDLETLEGVDAVREQLERVLNPPPPNNILQFPGRNRDLPPMPEEDDRIALHGPHNMYFRLLGYDHGNYFIFSYRKRQVLPYTKSDFNDGGFIELAPPSWWEINGFGGEKGINKKMAANALIDAADKVGIFNPANLRGRGAWFDEDRTVFHHGGFLTVDGQRMDVTDIRSKYVYELGDELCTPDEKALTDEEGVRLLGIANRFRWVKPGSAALLVGWCMIAPLGGILSWRPHIWLTGNAGCGKSTILKDFVNALTRGINIYAQSNTTEPGIRQKLKTDAIPVLFDEAEQNEEKDKNRVQAIIGLMRQSSTESDARTYKGTTFGHSMDFIVRSMFCLASIQVGIKHQADVERLAILSLKSSGKDLESIKEWKDLEETLTTFINHDKTISRRLFRRSLTLIPTILKNIDTFTSAAAKHFKSQRAGDQYGALLAGCYCMINQTEATPADAESLIRSFDWSEHIEYSDTDEGSEVLQVFMESHIRLGVMPVTVYELLRAAAGFPQIGLELDSGGAKAILARYGIKVDDHWLMLSNNSVALRTLMKGTNFDADWRGVMLRIDGADRNGNKTVWFNGVPSKVIRVPLKPLMSDPDAQAPRERAIFDPSQLPDFD